MIVQLKGIYIYITLDDNMDKKMNYVNISLLINFFLDNFTYLKYSYPWMCNLQLISFCLYDNKAIIN